MLKVFSEVSPLWLAGTYYHFRSSQDLIVVLCPILSSSSVCKVVQPKTQSSSPQTFSVPFLPYPLSSGRLPYGFQSSLVALNSNLHRSLVRLHVCLRSLFIHRSGESASWQIARVSLGLTSSVPFLPVITSCPACNKPSENNSFAKFFYAGGLI